MPKQYLNLLGQPIAMHSLNTFGHMPEVGEIIVVCDPSYRCPAEPPFAPCCVFICSIQLDHMTRGADADLQGSLPRTLEQVTQHRET